MASADHFAEQHRLVLKSKLLEKATALRLTEGRLHAVAQAAPVGIVFGDLTGAASHANARLEEITGQSRTRLLGHGWLDCLETTDRDRVLAAIAGGPPYGAGPYQVAMRGARAGRRWLDISIHAMDSDQRAGFIAVVADVTGVVMLRERVHAADGREAALRRQITYLADRLSETQDLTQAGTWSLDRSAGIITVSPGLCESLRLPSRRVRPGELLRWVHPEDRGRAIALGRRTVDGGEPQVVELRVGDRGGYAHELIVSCRWDGSGQAGVLRGIVQDVTGIRDAQRQRLRLQRIRYDERRVSEAMQRELLPGDLPAVPGLDLGATYRVAADRVDVGGDWYDVLCLPSGKVLLSVGDVHGQDGSPAAVMGSVRAALRAYAIEDSSPAALLARLNRFLIATYRDDTYITAAVAYYDPGSHSVRIASAGQPLPLLATPDRYGAPGARVVPVGRSGPPLGVLPHADFGEHRLTMPPQAALCLYTDGLAERHGTVAPTQLADLVAVVGRVVAGAPHGCAGPRAVAQELVDGIADELLADGPSHDDACLAMLRVPPSPAAYRPN